MPHNRERAANAAAGGMRIVAVASGKGGVGKTQIAVNLAVALARRSRRTLLLDADLGLANVGVLLGLPAAATLEHVLDGRKALEDVLVDGPAGLTIVPAASGVSRLADMSAREQSGLLGAFETLGAAFDFMVIDTATGVGQSVLGFCAAASEVLVVLCDDPASLTDAYALIKLLSLERGIKRFMVLCNRVRSATHGRMMFERLSHICDRFLNVSLCHVGGIPEDAVFSAAARTRRSVTEAYPSSPAGVTFKELATRADRWNVLKASDGRPTFFAERSLAVAGGAVMREAG